MIPVKCEQCGVLFNKQPCHIKRTSRNFCSKECYDSFQTSSLSKNCKVCGKTFTIRPCEWKKFSTCSLVCRRLSRTKGKNSNWRGGKTPSRNALLTRLEYVNWRRAVFERDSYTCNECGKLGGELHAHHIKPWAYFPGLRYDITNGITLCKPCHKKTFGEVFQWRAILKMNSQQKDNQLVPYYAVDLDGTLAEYTGWISHTHIGAPIVKMVERVQKWLIQGKLVKVFTARAAEVNPRKRLETINAIDAWTLKYIGRVLPITCIKDYGCVEIWDDRAIQIVPNTGERVDGED